MTVLPDAVRAYEQELLQKADMLAMGLKGLKSASPERAAEVLAEISSRLGRAVAAEPVAGMEDRVRDPRRGTPAVVAAPVVVAARGGGADDIEDFILDILAENPLGLSVQEIVDHLDEAQLDMKRRTLVVRLHRMVHAGKLASRAHGHYALSEAERTRRRA